MYSFNDMIISVMLLEQREIIEMCSVWGKGNCLESN